MFLLLVIVDNLNTIKLFLLIISGIHGI